MNNMIESNENMPAESHKNKKSNQTKNGSSFGDFCLILAVILIILSGLVITNTIHKGSEYAQIAYENAKEKAIDEAYNRFYESAFASAERKYHVTNTVSIEVAALREESNLEVLKVSDVEYVIEPKGENENNIEVWMEFYGDGIYTVDMKSSEFIIDSNRQYVLVRVPRPVLSHCTITETNELFWQNGLFNKSNSDGTELARKVQNAGYTKLINYMKSNAEFYKSAKDSATTVISDLVKGLNSELTNLVVEVEFID